MGAFLELVVRFLGSFKMWFRVLPWEAALRVRRGKKRVAFGLGHHWRLPFGIDHVEKRHVTQQVADLQSQSIRTKDRASLAVSGALRYEITDIDQAVSRVQDLKKSLKNLGSGVLANVVNELDDNDITVLRLQEWVLKLIRKHTEGWGIHVKSFYIVDLDHVKTLRHMGETSYGGLHDLEK